MNLHEIFGIIAGLIALATYPIYIQSIVTGTTRPSRVTWWILGLSGTLLAASYYASGARDTMWIASVYAIGYFVIAMFSLRYGHGTWTKMDTLLLALALASAGLWWLLNNPLIALYVNIGIDVFGIAPTIYKTYREPTTESRAAWFVDVLAAACAMLAISRWTVAIVLFPVYLFVTNGLILLLSFRNVKKQ